MAEPGPAEEYGPRSARHLLSLGVALPLLLYGATTLGYVSGYSELLYNKAWFLHQYRHGVYRYRFVGTDALLALNHVAHALGIDVMTKAVSRPRDSWSGISSRRSSS